MIALLFIACAARVPVEVRPPVEATDAFMIHAGDRTMAGLAAVSVTDEAWALQALTPTGLSVFTVRGDADGTEVTAPAEELAAALARIPFERDLWLLYRLRCEDRCRAEHGVLDVEGELLRWRGRGGRAEIVREPGRATLTDHRRGYDIVVLGEAVGG